MSKSRKNLNPHQRALLDVATGEHNYLEQSKAHDGYALGELQILDGTDEELHIGFWLKLNGKTAHFKYSLGFDVDEGGYLPYVEAEAGDEEHPMAFTTIHVGGEGYVKSEAELLDSIELLGRNCGEARFEVFQWLETCSSECPQVRSM